MSENSETKPGGNDPTMDQYGDAERSLISVRTAATDAAFFVTHLAPGMQVLDCGCGEGTITVGLAEVISPGIVVGIDVAAKTLEQAKQLANDRGLTNLEFQEASVYELPFPDESFDAVLAHSIFEHLSDWPSAIGEIRRVLKSGGFVGLRSPDYGAQFTEPHTPDIEKFWDLMVKIRDELGGRSIAGRQLPGLLETNGFQKVEANATLESFGTDESRRWWATIWAEFSLTGIYAREWLERRWVEEKTLQEFSDAWISWSKQPGAFAAVAWCEALGWKE